MAIIWVGNDKKAHKKSCNVWKFNLQRKIKKSYHNHLIINYNLCFIVLLLLFTHSPSIYLSIFQIKHHQRQHFEVLNFYRMTWVKQVVSPSSVLKMQYHYTSARDNQMDCFSILVSEIIKSFLVSVTPKSL